jgi:hypothetical protein
VSGFLDRVMETIRPAAPVPVTPRGGKREGAGRRKQAPAPVANPLDVAMDVARHVDPKTEAPDWTAELEDRFVQVYYDGYGSLRQACQALGVAYAAVKVHQKDSLRFASKLRLADELVREAVHDEHMRRVMQDPNRPASMIFELKSRDPHYRPVVNQHQAPVRVQIAITDGAFKTAPMPSVAAVTLPALAESNDPEEDVIDAS